MPNFSCIIIHYNIKFMIIHHQKIEEPQCVRGSLRGKVFTCLRKLNHTRNKWMGIKSDTITKKDRFKTNGGDLISLKTNRQDLGSELSPSKWIMQKHQQTSKQILHSQYSYEK